MPRLAIASSLLLVLAAFLAPDGGDLGAAEPPLTDLKAQMLRQLDDKDLVARARAFLPLHTRTEPEALGVVVDGTAKAAGHIERVRGEQLKAEAAYEKACTGLDDLEKAYEERNDSSPRATEAFNKVERKLSGQRDAARKSLRDLESQMLSAKALVDAGVVAAAAVLGNLDGPALGAGIDLLEGAWLRAKDEAQALKFFDALAGTKGDEPTRRAIAVVGDERVGLRVRAAAVDYLGGKKVGELPDLVLPFLQGGRAQFDLMAASIRAIRLVHRRGGIEPLIAFLGRPDEEIGRLRGDAHVALQSLTGQTHGPYKDPWQSWWDKEKDTFQLPDNAKPQEFEIVHNKGVTFYGIRTFSDRILLILDVSLSMEKPDQAGKPEPRRIDTAKKEADGAIHNVENGHTFNVMLFNHSVTPWQPAMVVATEETRRKAATWVKEAEHIGGTNIHDALETGFRMALKATDEPVIDTIFFMTDGTPTAGKIQEPAAILEQVREWNRLANCQIHCIAVGEADHEFLKKLAQIGNGTFINR